jgi:cell division protein FtsL
MATWTGAASVEPAAPRVRPAPRAKPTQRARPRADARRRAQRTPVAGSVAWIVLVAVLLAGVVAMNVAVLRLNMALDRLGRERVQLRGENAALASQLSSSAAAPKIQSLARHKLGLEPASADATTYVDLGR